MRSREEINTGSVRKYQEGVYVEEGVYSHNIVISALGEPECIRQMCI